MKIKVNTTAASLQSYIDSFYKDPNKNTRVYDFFSSSLEEGLIPKKTILKKLKKTFSDKSLSFGYNPPYGEEIIRKVIAKSYLSSKLLWRNVLITNGAQEALYIAMEYIKQMTGKKQLNIGVETYSYVGFRDIVERSGGRIFTIPINQNGIDINSLTSLAKHNNIDILYIIPDLHNPTGITYSLKVRKEILKTQKKFGFYLIADVCYRDLYFNKRNKKSLKDLINEKSFIVGGFSKILSPNFRLGWIYNPKHFYHLALIKRSINLFSTTFIQTALAYFLRNGYKTLEKNVLKILEIKKNYMIYLLNYYNFQNNYTWNNPDGSFYILLKSKSDSFLKPDFFIKKQVMVGLGKFFNPEEKKQSIRLCYSYLNCQDIKTGLARIASTQKSKKTSDKIQLTYVDLKTFLLISFYKILNIISPIFS
ncbi:MAG: PLP-dependent aminotransferase family protein [Patescibacteria group bacterium]